MINMLDKKIKAVYTGPGGYDSDKEQAERVLVEGREYTVEALYIGKYKSTVQLLEVGDLHDFENLRIWMFDFYDAEGNSIDIVGEYKELFGY
jgi:hypothetical protein